MSAPAGVKRDYPLSRLTTVRAGGSADFFARPESEDEVIELLTWAQREGLAIGVVGSGSNLLVSDRMNANAYGGELGRVLESVVVCTAGGSERRRPEDLGFRYRGSDLDESEVVARAGFALSESNPADVKATMADMRRRRKEAQPSGIKTFGSTFMNPEDPRADGRSAGQLLDAADCRGLQVGGARLSPKHANFVENTGTATTADILEVMAEARRRVHERFGVTLEPEVQVLGEVSWPRQWQLER